MGIAIVNHNTRDELEACLATVSTIGAGEIVVVDNASTDGSAAMVRQDYPGVLLEVNRRNLGYGVAANQAIAQCHGRYVLLLNSDTRLPPNALLALTCYLDQHPQVGIVGPRLIHPDGTLQRSGYPFPTPWHLFLQESGIGQLVQYIPALREKYLRTWSHDYPRPVSWVLGAALAIRREAFDQVGGFDQGFFMYSEEVDLCRRLRQSGWEIHVAPVTVVTHVGGASTGKQPAAMRVQYFRSVIQLYSRHFSRPMLVQAIALLYATALARLCRDIVRMRLTRDPDERSRLCDNVVAWRRILADRSWIQHRVG